jgi:hypothetical protein
MILIFTTEGVLVGDVEELEPNEFPEEFKND